MAIKSKLDRAKDIALCDDAGELMSDRSSAGRRRLRCASIAPSAFMMGVFCVVVSSVRDMFSRTGREE